jgi:hypothetical protein
LGSGGGPQITEETRSNTRDLDRIAKLAKTVLGWSTANLVRSSVSM